MKDSILNFAKQFDYQPEIKNQEKLKKTYQSYVLGGMGGSALAVGILKNYDPNLNLFVHRDYGVPNNSDEFNKSALFIASSYSGNTEETYDFADEAYSKGHDLIIISTGGKLIKFAQENNLPYIQIPDTGIQPRVAIGFSVLAVAMIINQNLFFELQKLSKVLKPELLEKDGQGLAQILKGKIPVIFTSPRNQSIAYNWKIKINETGKIPAFYNLFPELNHNEMQGYDFVEANQELSKNFHFIFITDADENLRIAKRIEVLEQQLQSKGFSVNKIYLTGNSRLEKIFNAILLADWTALSLSEVYGTEPEQVPLIEEFKQKIG